MSNALTVVCGYGCCLWRLVYLGFIDEVDTANGYDINTRL